MIDHFVKLTGGHLLGSCKIWREAGIQITGTGAHHQSRCGREAHTAVHAFAVPHGGQTRASLEMGYYDATFLCWRIAKACEFFHQISVGQTMETVALDSLGIEPARNWQQLGHAWHRLVKRRVKARQLR